MHRMLPLSLVLAALIAFTPQNISATSAVGTAAGVAAGFAVYALIFSVVTFGVGITAAHEPGACDLNSQYNITVEGKTTYPCQTCSREGCVDRNCTRAIVLCENAEGERIDGLQTNNPRYLALIWATGAIGVAAGTSVFLSIAGCVGVCTSMRLET